MFDILHEPIQTQLYFKEYLDKIKFYKNIQRKSLFIRYFNIDPIASTYQYDTTKGTFDHYNSGIYYNIYDYTPAFNIATITNSSTDKVDMAGMAFDSLADITIYTITEPRIGDLITFPYEPSITNEVFRVIQIETSIHVKEYGINYNRLSLEYAPIKEIHKLNIAHQYVYLLSQERNVLQKDYIDILNTVNTNKSILTTLSSFFNDKFELYYNSNFIASLSLNKYIYDFLCYESKQNRYYDFFKKPFGVNNYTNYTNKGIDILTGNIINIDNSLFSINLISI